jgi:hypothetical protein
MTSGSDEQNAIALNRPLLKAGVVLLAVGGVLASVGGLVATVAAVGATRNWVQQWEEPPNAKARRAYQQARSAAVAGAQGWRQNGYQSSVGATSGPTAG